MRERPPRILQWMWLAILATLPFTHALTLDIGFPLKLYEIIGSALIPATLFWWFRSGSARRYRTTGPIPLALLIYVGVFLAAVIHGAALMQIERPDPVWAVGRAHPDVLTWTKGAYLLFDVGLMISGIILLQRGGVRLFRSTVRAGIAGGVASAAYGIYQTLGYWLVGNTLPLLPMSRLTRLEGLARSNGPFLEANYHALFLVIMLLAILWHWFFDARDRRSRWLWAIPFSIVMISLILTFSLSGLVCLGVSWIGFALILVLRAPGRLKAFGMLTALLLLLLPAHLARTTRPGTWKSWPGTSRTRVEWIRGAAAIGADHPILGVGPGNAGYYMADRIRMRGVVTTMARPIPNNTYAEHFAETGTIGLLAWTALLLSLGWVAARSIGQGGSPRTRAAGSILLLGLIVYAIGLNAFPTHLMTFAWVYFALIGSVSLGETSAPSPPTGTVPSRAGTFHLFGVRIDAVQIPEATSRILGWSGSRERTRFVVAANQHLLTEALLNPSFRVVMGKSDLTVPDGTPLVLAGRLKGFGLARRVYGPELMTAVLDRGRSLGLRHFFYGGHPTVPERLADEMKRRFPGLRVAGTHSPPFGPLARQEDPATLRRLNESGADILWVGLGAPKQELWMESRRDQLRIPVLVGVGQAFDIHTATVRQAPEWMRENGLEWSFRLALEPRRLAPRYIIQGGIFASRFLIELCTGGLRKERG